MKITGNGIHIERLSLPRLAWLFIALCMIWHLLYVSCSTGRRETIIRSDAAGYYVYLPATFIYHDLQYRFCSPGDSAHPNSIAAQNTLFLNRTISGKHVNKYFIGTSVLELPFFLGAYSTASLFGYAANGYTFPFQIAIALAGIFYALFGLGQIRRLMHKRKIPEPIQAITLLLLFFGTNLYHYSLVEPGMSHVFSFAAIALLLNLSHDVFHEPKKWSVFWLLTTFVLIVSIRPVNGVVLLAVPMIAGSWTNFKSGIMRGIKQSHELMMAGGILVVVAFLQLLVYKISTDQWLADSYSGEHFDPLNSHFYNVLFSWRKGWLLYTPLMIFAIVGTLYLKSSFERIFFFCFLLVNIWMISSWQQWSYGGSFGMRPFVESYPVMAIPLAHLLVVLFRKWRTVFALPVFGFLVLLNLIQLYQYSMSILPYDGMTMEKYSRLFMKTNLEYMYIYDPGRLQEHTLPENSQKISHWIRTFEEDTTYHTISYWEITNEMAYQGKNSVKLAKGQSTAGLCVALNDAVPDSTLWSSTWVKIKAKVFLPEESFRPSMAISFRSDGKEYSWQACPLYFNINTLGSWQNFEYNVKLPLPPSSNAEVCIFLVHGDSSVAYADNMEMDFYTAQ